MPIDTSMYNTQGSPLVSGFETGMRFGNMIQRGREESAVKDAFTKNTTTDANGNVAINRGGLMSDLAKFSPEKALEVSRTIAQNDKSDMESHAAKVKAHMDNLDAVARLAGTAVDQPSYEKALQQAKAYGVDTTDLPTQYDPRLVQNIQAQALTTKERLEQLNKDRDDQRKRDEHSDRMTDNQNKRQSLDWEKADKLGKNLNDHLDKGWTARSGQAGKVQEKINNAEAVEQLLDQAKKQPGGLDSRQIQELAIATNRMLGGSDAASQIEHLLPHTWYGRAMSLQEALTNSPTGQGLEKFTSRMAETVAREKEKAQDQKRQFQIEGLAAHSALKKKDPALYNSILASKGITPEMVDENGRYKKALSGAAQGGDSAAAHPQDAQAVAWAKANPDDPRAQKILQLNGAGQ